MGELYGRICTGELYGQENCTVQYGMGDLYGGIVWENLQTVHSTGYGNCMMH